MWRTTNSSVHSLCDSRMLSITSVHSESYISANKSDILVGRYLSPKSAMLEFPAVSFAPAT